jgi:hypothetical protein
LPGQWDSQALSTKKIRPAAQDLHKGSHNLHAPFNASAKASFRLKGVRLENGPGWICVPLSADHTARPKVAGGNERKSDGYITDTNSHRNFGVSLNILHLPISVTLGLVSGHIGLTTV